MNIFNFLKRMFTHYCPDCGGEMESMLDGTAPCGGRLIYKCKKCGKEWI